MWLRRLMAGLLAVMLASSLGGRQAEAQSSQTFTLAAGGRAVITFEAFCIDFGGSFPQSIQAPSSLAPSAVRAALAYIQTNNMSAQPATALRAQYAIWRLAGARNSPKGDATTEAVVAAAKTTPPDPAGATSILSASNAGSVVLDTISWGPIGSPMEITQGSFDYFYGRGQLVVRNRTQQQLTLFMPVGAVFLPGYSGSQRVIGYSTAVTVLPAGSLPNTASFGMQPLLALLAIGFALPIHIWRKRRAQLIGRRRVA